MTIGDKTFPSPFNIIPEAASGQALGDPTHFWTIYGYNAGDGWHLISETVLGGNAASITFSSIPDDYRTLVLNIQARTDRAAENDTIFVNYNGDSTDGHYDWLWWRCNGISAGDIGVARATTTMALSNCAAANSTGNNFGISEITIPGYARNDRQKQAYARTARFGNVASDADLYYSLRTGRWRDTDPITSILLVPQTGPNFVSGSIFTLYGIN